LVLTVPVASTATAMHRALSAVVLVVEMAAGAALRLCPMLAVGVTTCRRQVTSMWGQELEPSRSFKCRRESVGTIAAALFLFCCFFCCFPSCTCYCQLLPSQRRLRSLLQRQRRPPHHRRPQHPRSCQPPCHPRRPPRNPRRLTAPRRNAHLIATRVTMTWARCNG